MCLDVLPECISVHHMCAVSPEARDRGFRSSGTGVTPVVSCHVDAVN